MGSKGLCPLFATGRGAEDKDVSCPVQLWVGTRIFPHLNLEGRLAKPCASPSPYRTSRESPRKFWQALHRALFGAKQGLHPPPRSLPHAGSPASRGHRGRVLHRLNLTLASRQREVRRRELRPWQSIIAALAGRNRCCSLLTLSWRLLNNLGVMDAALRADFQPRRGRPRERAPQPPGHRRLPTRLFQQSPPDTALDQTHQWSPPGPSSSSGAYGCSLVRRAWSASSRLTSLSSSSSSSGGVCPVPFPAPLHTGNDHFPIRLAQY